MVPNTIVFHTLIIPHCKHLQSVLLDATIAQKSAKKKAIKQQRHFALNAQKFARSLINLSAATQNIHKNSWLYVQKSAKNVVKNAVKSIQNIVKIVLMHVDDVVNVAQSVCAK